MSEHHPSRLNSAEWARQRRRCFARDGYRCRWCGKRGKLEAHHDTPVDEGGTDDLDNLLTVCRGCHIAHHRAERERQRSESERAWAEFVAELL